MYESVREYNVSVGLSVTSKMPNVQAVPVAAIRHSGACTCILSIVIDGSILFR